MENRKIHVIDKSAMEIIVPDKTVFGRYLTLGQNRETGDIYLIACDNSTGEAHTEEFNSLSAAAGWLLGELSAEQAHAADSERVKCTGTQEDSIIQAKKQATSEELLIKWARRLTDRQYLQEVSDLDAKEMKEDGVVALYGYSDDCAEFAGALCDEVGCYEEDERIMECPQIVARFDWCDDGDVWAFKTDIPHKVFQVFEGEKLFCEGIVFMHADAGAICHNYEE